MAVHKSVEYSVFIQDLKLGNTLTKRVEKYLREVSPDGFRIEGYGGITEIIAVPNLESREEAEAVQRQLEIIINS